MDDIIYMGTVALDCWDGRQNPQKYGRFEYWIKGITSNRYFDALLFVFMALSFLLLLIVSSFRYQSP